MTTPPARSSIFLTALGYAATRAAFFGVLSVILMIVIKSYATYISALDAPTTGSAEGWVGIFLIGWCLLGIVMFLVFLVLALIIGGLVALAVPSVAHSASLSILAAIVVCLPILIPAHFLLLELIYSGSNHQLTYTTDYVSYFVIPALSLIGVALLTGNRVRKVLGMVA